MSSALPNACSEIGAPDLPVHAAAGIGRDLLDLGDRLAKPLQRRGLHRADDPAVERRDDRTGECRVGFHLHRHRSHDRLTLRAERRQRPRALRRDRRRCCAGTRIWRQFVIVVLRMRRRAARLRLLVGLLPRRVVLIRLPRRWVVRLRRIVSRLLLIGRLRLIIWLCLIIRLRLRALPVRGCAQVRRRRAELLIALLHIALLYAWRFNRHRYTGLLRRGVARLGHRRVIRLLLDRPARLGGRPRRARIRTRDRARRPQLLAVAHRRAFAERRNLQRKIRAAHARPIDGRDAHDACAFLHRSGIEAGDFRVLAPGRAHFVAQKAPAAARERDQNDAATEDPTHATRHARTMRRIFLRTL